MTPEQTILTILAEQLCMPVEQLATTDKLQDIGLDSIRLVEGLFLIEEALNITLPFNANLAQDEQMPLTTVGELIDAVKQHMSIQA